MRLNSYDGFGTLYAEHLRKMLAIIGDLNATSKLPTKEKQIKTVLPALPKSWKIMKLTMTNNKTYYICQLLCHFDLMKNNRVFKLIFL